MNTEQARRLMKEGCLMSRSAKSDRSLWFYNGEVFVFASGNICDKSKDVWAEHTDWEIVSNVVPASLLSREVPSW